MSDTIDWLGHATVRIELDGIRILTDPTIRDRIGPLDRKVAPIPHHEVAGIDVVIVSHLHQDHLDLPSLRRLGGDVRLIVPEGSAEIFRAAGHRDVDELAPGGRTTHGPLTIEAVRADHSGFRPPFGPTAPALGFVISSHRRRVYFAGDTALYPEMAEIADLDVALLPVWGWGPNLRGGHMDPVMAADALTLLRPRFAVPIHWGTFWPKAFDLVRPDRLRLPGIEFRAAVREKAPKVRTEILQPGGGFVLRR
jgi:L-ascorbate metabolism protein UlaG (beta-lactamase superfamily)